MVTNVDDLLVVPVRAGGRVLVVSDLHLGARPTAASRAAAAEVGRAIDAWAGPGVVVLGGDLLELLAGPPDAAAALAAHPDLTAALRRFADDDEHRVVAVVGNHDGRLAWDERAATAVRDSLGADLALAVDLVLETGRGERRVRVEHGHRFDPPNAVADPRNPAETPLGHHVVTELLPALPARPWLEGVESLADPVSLPAFVTSRIAYRRVGRHLGWLLLPLVVGAALRVPLRWELGVLAVLADLALVLAVLGIVGRRAWRALGEVAIGERGINQNDHARDEARRLVTEGFAGLVTGHTHHAELTTLGDGFYANTGCGSTVVEAAPARFGLPAAYLASRRLSWVELEAGADLHVRLLDSRTDLPGASLLERALTRRPLLRRAAPAARPAVVAALPQGASWPPVVDPAFRQRRIRRAAAVAIGLAGVLDIASALTPPLRERLHLVVGLVPLAVPQAAAAIVAIAGLALLALARGVRRGQRHAWALAVALLAGTVVLHLVKGADVEEALVALGLAVWLVRHHREFRGAVDRPSLRLGLLTVAGGLAIAFTVGTIAATTVAHLALASAALAVAERLVGVTTVALPDRVGDFLTPALAAVGFGLGGALGWMAFRPVVRRHRDGGEIERARDIVRRHGRDTLAYFALRDDKEHYFWRDTVVAYAVLGGVCLVSPDPVGPPAERDAAWSAFRAFADASGWTVAVMGASEEWLPVYRGAGMRDLYIGDEAVVDCRTFRLDGGDRKGLRQAVNRVARGGYTIEFHRPGDLTPELRAGLTRIMADSRRGDVERGFSMTLGRAFERKDADLLLAVAIGPDGTPAAFCQYVPAPGIEGWSLDLMRRSDAEHPNGVTDFVVVRTLEWMREHGYRGLGLNFATMRAVIAGEAGTGFGKRVERRVLQWLSDSMQIESLWKYNAKFGPTWQPRYAVYDSPEHVLSAALAVARAESFWELPVIGRFLTPSSGSGAQPVSGPPDGLDHVATERPVDLVP